jgi:hypothetical protein
MNDSDSLAGFKPIEVRVLQFIRKLEAPFAYLLEF